MPRPARLTFDRSVSALMVAACTVATSGCGSLARGSTAVDGSGTTTTYPALQVYGPVLAAVVALLIASLPPLWRSLKTPRLLIEHDPTAFPEDVFQNEVGIVRWRLRVLNRGHGPWIPRTAQQVEVLAVGLEIDGERKTVSGRRLPWTIALDSRHWGNATPLRVPGDVSRYVDVMELRPDADHARIPLRPRPAGRERYDIALDGTQKAGTPRCSLLLVAVADDVPATYWRVEVRTRGASSQAEEALEICVEPIRRRSDFDHRRNGTYSSW